MLTGKRHTRQGLIRTERRLSCSRHNTSASRDGTPDDPEQTIHPEPLPHYDVPATHKQHCLSRSRITVHPLNRGGDPRATRRTTFSDSGAFIL